METVQLLGLDVEVVLVVTLLVMEAAAGQLGRLRRAAGKRTLSKAGPGPQAAEPLPGVGADPWTQPEWRPSH